MAYKKLKKIDKPCATPGCKAIMYQVTSMKKYCPRCAKIRNNKCKRRYHDQIIRDLPMPPDEEEEKIIPMRSGWDDILDNYLNRHDMDYQQAVAIAKGI